MTPENEQQLYDDLSKAYRLSSTKMNQAISKAYADARDRMIDVIEPPITPPVEPPVVTPPITPPPVEPPVEPPVTPPANGFPMPGTQYPYKPVNPTNIGYREISQPNQQLENFISTGIYNRSSGLRLSSGYIDGQNNTENGIQFNEYSATGIEITRTKDGMKAHGNVLVDRCWIHDLTVTPTSHNDGIQISGGTNIVIRDSRFEATEGQPEQKGTAAVFVKPENDGTVGTVTIEGCYFNRWGNFFIQTSKSNTSKTAIDHLIVRNNVFGKTVTYVDWAVTHRLDGIKKITWENNVDIYGKPVLLEAPRRIS